MAYTMKRFWTTVLAGALACTNMARAADEARDGKSPWAIASGAEWSKEYPRFNPMLRDAGVRWLRLFPEWQSIQPGKGDWDFDGADAIVADAKKNNIRIAGIFCFFSKWTSATGDTRTGPVKDMQFWRDYVEGCVNRYKADIKYWEVWNEFNGSFYNSRNGQNAKPKEYADLVKNAYDVAKKADPNVMIGMSCANFDLGFFDLAIKAGAAGKFDFIAVHPYENLGMAMDGNEAAYLSLAPSIRKMLSDNKQNPNMPLWITETGMQSTIRPDAPSDDKQAEALVKVYVLSIAQGFDKVFWFEARGPAYGKGTDHGLIREDWSRRPAYDAMKVMTTQLGAEPKYVGWLDLSGAYGFVFDSGKGDVLVTWAAKDKDAKPAFSAPVRVISKLGDESKLAVGAALELTRQPVYVLDLPADLSKLARENAAKPFPWGGGYANATEVSCRLAATNVDKGIKQVKEGTTEPVNLLDQSYRLSRPSKGGENNYVYFRVDPEFASFGNKELEITVVAKRADVKKASSFTLTYESMTGYKGPKEGRWTIPAADEWHEHTWKVTDANFVGGWGWNFRTDAGGSAGDFIIKEVRVKRAAK